MQRKKGKKRICLRKLKQQSGFADCGLFMYIEPGSLVYLGAIAMCTLHRCGAVYPANTDWKNIANSELFIFLEQTQEQQAAVYFYGTK